MQREERAGPSHLLHRRGYARDRTQAIHNPCVEIHRRGGLRDRRPREEPVESLGFLQHWNLSDSDSGEPAGSRMLCLATPGSDLRFRRKIWASEQSRANEATESSLTTRRV